MLPSRLGTVPKETEVLLKPPSTTRLIPLTYFYSSLVKYRAAFAMSSGSKHTPFRVTMADNTSSTFFVSSIPRAFLSMGVATQNGDIQLTLIP